MSLILLTLNPKVILFDISTYGMRKAGIPNIGIYYCLNHLVGNKNKL